MSTIYIIITVLSLLVVLGLNAGLCKLVSIKFGSIVPKYLIFSGALFPLILSACLTQYAPLDQYFLDLAVHTTINSVYYCATAIFIFGIASFISGLIIDFRSQLGTLIGIVLFAVLGLVSYYKLIAYMLSESYRLSFDLTVLEPYEASGMTVTPVQYLYTSGSILLVCILGGLASLSWIISTIRSLLIK
ncbi:MAG: hypothetical protein CL823_06935 [Crocinitomicaceae bacterium]|nr:hypothetical protein [Crocinitomicaceae bacterium]|tara:strand:- start:2117 stop:2683 length:567 start_codon:yes stop_codon:yes gene_type:complete